MKTINEKQALQNFADKFDLTVVSYHFGDKRKKGKFILVNNKMRISPPLTYNEMNMFLLGINSTFKK